MTNLHASEIMLDELPFEPHTDNLKSVIRKKYLTTVAKWLLGKNDGRILAEESNSNWESALSIIFFTNFRETLLENNEESDLCEQLPSICTEVARHLLRKKIILSDQYVCWDKVTWDTAVVTRALLQILKAYPDRFSESEREELMDCATKALTWLFMRFEKWETEIKYPFGPADVAQILLTSIYFKQNFHNEYNKTMKTNSSSKKTNSIELQICRYLFKIMCVKIHTIDGIEEKLISWGDFFQTAETLDSLATYCLTLDSEDDKKLKVEIKETCRQTLRFIEFEQSEDSGTWGTHVDTMRILYAYVKVSELIPTFDSEPHIIFKALRWICDEKQRFDDGSFLHTMFLTIFMCDALLVIHNDWPLANKPIIKIYDDVVWASPMRTTSERTKRFAVETENQWLSNELEDTRNELNEKSKSILMLISTGTTISIFFIIAYSLSLYEITWLSSDVPTLISLAAAIAFIYIPIMIIIEKIFKKKS